MDSASVEDFETKAREVPVDQAGQSQVEGAHLKVVSQPVEGQDGEPEARSLQEQQDGEAEARSLQEQQNGQIGETKESLPSSDEAAKQSVSFLSMFRYATPFDILLMALGSMGAFIAGASLPVFMVILGKLVNTLGNYADDPAAMSEKISKQALSFVYLAIITLFTNWIEVSCWMQAGERQAAHIRSLYLRSILRQDVGYFDTEISTGEIVGRVAGDVIAVQEALGEKVGNYIHNMGMFLVGLVVGFITLWQLALVMLGAFPFIVIAGVGYQVSITGLAAKGQAAYADAGSVAQQAVSSIRTVYSFVMEARTVADYCKALDHTLRLGKWQSVAKGLGFGSTFLVLYSVWALQFWVGSLLVAGGDANGGKALTTMFCIILGGVGVGQAAPNLKYFAEGRIAAYRIFAIIIRKPFIDSHDLSGETPSKVVGKLELRDVDFAYPSRPSVPIFRKFNLTVEPGKQVALVGSSGSGKSTVVSLLERFYDPTGGSVTVDGIDLRQLRLQWLRDQLGLVSQEPALFAVSIKDNILYGKAGATMEDIIAAAKAANAHNFISALPEGYDTQVGERGVQMSGGQKQRIAIARAVIKNPAILLLDEATSALDSESEKVVQQALDSIMVGRTTVVIAHRLSTIRNADKIAVVREGAIIEQGTHNELMAIGEEGAYASLVRLQDMRQREDDPAAPTRHRLSFQLSNQRSGLGSTHQSLSFSHSNLDGGPGSEGGAVDGLAKGISKPSYWRLLKMNKPEWPYALLGIVGAIFAGFVNPLFALGLSEVIGLYFKPDVDQMKKDVARWSLVFVGAGVYTLVVFTIQHTFFGFMGETLTRRIREAMFRQILRFEVAWFDDELNSSGAVAARLASEATVVRSVVGDRLCMFTQQISTICMSLVIGFILSWKLTLVILACYPLLITSALLQHRFLKGFAIDAAQNYEEASKVAGEAVSNMRTVAAFNAETKVLNLFNGKLAGPLSRSFVRGQIGGISLGASQFILFSAFALAFWYGGVLVKDGEIPFDRVLKVTLVMIMSAFAIADATSMTPDLAKGAQAIPAVFNILDRASAIDPDEKGQAEVDALRGRVELKKVTFAYPTRPDVELFKDFNLVVDPGSVLALVGQSGSGKSTVISLIERFYDPLEGQVLVDGQDIRRIQLRSLRQQIGLVQQEPVLFATTIRENILYGKRGAAEAEVIEAARAANAHNFISSLPAGYETQVGERGVQMSGGQKQRIAIARAVIKNPAILLLDEATSALDSESEKVVQEALDRIMVGRTTVVIAHRLSTIRNASVIAVVQDGKVVEKGNHNDLLAKGEGGAYWSLVNLQKR